MTMQSINERVHEHTLVGAVDSYLKTLVRVRPQIAGAYGGVLEQFADLWVREFHANHIGAVPETWVATYLVVVDRRPIARAALTDFYAWAEREQLLQISPMPPEQRHAAA